MKADILQKFTTHLRQSLKNSFKVALELRHMEIAPAHLLYGLSNQRGSLAGEILGREGITKDKVVEILTTLPKGGTGEELPFLSQEAQEVLERAAVASLDHGHRYIGTEHLLYSLSASKNVDLDRIFAHRPQFREKAKKHLNEVLNSVNNFPEIVSLMGQGSMQMGQAMHAQGQAVKNRPRRNSVLEFFTYDLTSPNAYKKMDPIVGRDREIQRVIQILCRRHKNNPVLLGDPGVGKTAIVEGLSQRIVEGDVPDELQGKRILQLDLGLMIAGTIYRGEFEGRLKQLLDEVIQDPEIILFIDELHTIVGAGSASGTLDAANMLKPALARGQIHCIGATTYGEYKKSIESDAALERRFQAVIVDEPSREETIEILKGLRGNYEKYHYLTISDEAVVAAVDLSARYMPDKFFPDKAIDLLDEAASAKKLTAKTSRGLRELKKLQRELAGLDEQKQEAVLQEKFDEAVKIKNRESVLLEEIKKVEEKREKKLRRDKKETIGRVEVAKIVAQIVGLRPGELSDLEGGNIKNLAEKLETKIIGQDEAMEEMAKILRRAHMGLSDPRRPLASFLFVGPTGVGKTEAAKVLAEAIFPPDSFVRVDMSEFGEAFNVSKLLGAPAGYVGYKEGNKFTDKIKHHPYSVVLFDEIDKAHPEVFNIFLQMLDEGHLTDASGRKINFKNTVIIMTTNLGQENFSNTKFGFSALPAGEAGLDKKEKESIKKSLLTDLKNRFRADVLNRLESILVFQPLGLNDLAGIVELKVTELNQRLKDKNIVLELSEPAKKFLAQESAKLDQGARAVYKVVQNQIEEPLSVVLLELGAEKNKKIKIELVKGEIKLN